MLLNNQWIPEEIKEEIKKYLKTNENENTKTQNLYDAAKVFLRKKFIAIQSLPLETRKISNKEPSLTLKGTRKMRTNKTQSLREERNQKDESRNK